MVELRWDARDRRYAVVCRLMNNSCRTYVGKYMRVLSGGTYVCM